MELNITIILNEICLKKKIPSIFAVFILLLWWLWWISCLTVFLLLYIQKYLVIGLVSTNVTAFAHAQFEVNRVLLLFCVTNKKLSNCYNCNSH